MNYSEILNGFRIEGEPLPQEKMEQIIAACQSAGLTEQQLSEQLSMTAKEVASLPQRSVIPSSRKAQWIAETLSVEPERLAWHARRLRGIGGSEIGVLVEWKRDPEQYFVFNTPRDIVAGKLMMQAPDGGSGDTRRGIFMEDVIRNIFLKKINGKRRIDIMDRMSDVVIDGHEWLVGNPDDVFSAGDDNQVFLCDYKCPRQETFEYLRKNNAIKFDYVCQLHHLHMIASRAVGGTNASLSNKMFLVSMDYNNWDADMAVVDFDPEIANDLISIGDKVWNEYVMQGRLPEIYRKPEFDIGKLDPHVSKEIHELSKEVATFSALFSATKRQVDNAKARLTMALSSRRLGDSVLRECGIAVKADQDYDHAKILKLMKRNNLDCRNYDTGNPEAISASLKALADAGEDISLCVSERLSVSMSRVKTGEHADYLQKCAELARSVLEDISPPDFQTQSPNQKSSAQKRFSKM